MAKSPEAIAAAAVARIQQEAFQAGLKQGREEGFRRGWEACAEKVTNVTKVIPSVPRVFANARSRATSDASKHVPEPSADELEIQQWFRLGSSAASEASRSYWQLLPDFLEKEEVFIDKLELRVTTYTTLKREGVHTIGDITRKSLNDFFDMRGFAQKSFFDLYAAMAKFGYGMVTREE